MTTPATVQSHPVEILRQRYAWHIRQLDEIFSDPAFLQLTHTGADELPAAELEAFLSRLDINYPDINYPDSSHLRIKLAIWACIQRLACFRYRVIHTSADGRVHIWNPLEIPLKEWLRQHPRYGRKMPHLRKNCATPPVLSTLPPFAAARPPCIMRAVIFPLTS